MIRLRFQQAWTAMAFALVVLGWNLRAQAAQLACLTCHEDQKKQFEASAHAQAGMTCVDCHGGNAAATDETAHATDDFKRPANKREIAESCARCHSDVRRMNPYGLQTDQLERYKTSKHGEQLFEHGDEKVAACTDCHGTHDILKAASPQSHTHPANIPSTCGRCHSDEKLMSQYKLSADVVEQYKSSYHAHLLFEKGDLSAPTCVTCHGNHGAVAPGVEVVGQVCGKCHAVQRELFEKSPHAEAASAGVFNECVSCHGNHAIQKASLELFSTSCVQCHEGDFKQLGLRDTVAKIVRNANREFERASAHVKASTIRGLATEDEQLLLQEAKTQLTQLEALQHTLSPEQLQPASSRLDEIVKQVFVDIQKLENVELWKRRALPIVWIFMALMVVLFIVKRRQLSKKDES